jgi:hypothetical protein
MQWHKHSKNTKYDQSEQVTAVKDVIVLYCISFFSVLFYEHIKDTKGFEKERRFTDIL